MNTKTQPAASEPSSGEREGIAEMIREAHDLSLDEMHRAAREKMLEAAALLSSDARTAGQAEPVAWLYKSHDGRAQAFTNEPPPRLKALCQPLYTAQPAPQAVPQAEAVRVQHGWNPTDEELTTIYKKANGEDVGKAQPLTTQRIFTAMRAMLLSAANGRTSYKILISTDGCDGNHGGPACASPGCWHRD